MFERSGSLVLNVLEISFYLILFLGADLANLVNAAAIYAATEGDQSVTTRHLEFARDKILMGEYFIFFWLYKTYIIECFHSRDLVS